MTGTLSIAALIMSICANNGAPEACQKYLYTDCPKARASEPYFQKLKKDYLKVEIFLACAELGGYLRR